MHVFQKIHTAYIYIQKCASGCRTCQGYTIIMKQILVLAMIS